MAYRLSHIVGSVPSGTMRDSNERDAQQAASPSGDMS
jgi:hypothetical protein